MENEGPLDIGKARESIFCGSGLSSRHDQRFASGDGCGRGLESRGTAGDFGGIFCLLGSGFRMLRGAFRGRVAEGPAKDSWIWGRSRDLARRAEASRASSVPSLDAFPWDEPGRVDGRVWRRGRRDLGGEFSLFSSGTCVGCITLMDSGDGSAAVRRVRDCARDCGRFSWSI